MSSSAIKDLWSLHSHVISLRAKNQEQMLKSKTGQRRLITSSSQCSQRLKWTVKMLTLFINFCAWIVLFTMLKRRQPVKSHGTSQNSLWMRKVKSSTTTDQEIIHFISNQRLSKCCEWDDQKYETSSHRLKLFNSSEEDARNIISVLWFQIWDQLSMWLLFFYLPSEKFNQRHK